MFKFVDNEGCTLYLHFVADVPVVYGDVRTFTKSIWVDTLRQWNDLLESLRLEGYTKLYSQLESHQHNMIKFEKRVGFKVIHQQDDKIVLSKDL